MEYVFWFICWYTLSLRFQKTRSDSDCLMKRHKWGATLWGYSKERFPRIWQMKQFRRKSPLRVLHCVGFFAVFRFVILFLFFFLAHIWSVVKHYYNNYCMLSINSMSWTAIHLSAKCAFESPLLLLQCCLVVSRIGSLPISALSFKLSPLASLSHIYPRFDSSGESFLD